MASLRSASSVLGGDFLKSAHSDERVFLVNTLLREILNAMIMTGNRGFGEWADIFGDPVVATALLDRLLHHAVVVPIEGNSYRLREHANLIPEHLQNRTIPNGESFAEIKRRPGRPRKEYQSSEKG